jgi:5-methylcytosine-specific restriction protein B
MLDPSSGDAIEYALPHDLYIVAAMNQADASVEPLDVAFLRRWEPMRLQPNEAALRAFYGLGGRGADVLPDNLANIVDALEASVRAWASVNEQISLGRGPEFQVGHGLLMTETKPQTVSLQDALATLCIGWAKIRAHVEEVFFGDTRGIAAAVNALDGPAFNPFKLTEMTFADDLRFQLEGPVNFNEANIYQALRAFARS